MIARSAGFFSRGDAETRREIGTRLISSLRFCASARTMPYFAQGRRGAEERAKAMPISLRVSASPRDFYSFAFGGEAFSA
jgi:hypothetical protein